jgi:hypothetical protein
MVDRLPQGSSTEDLFSRAREQVIRCYQQVILDDYLPSILDEDVVTQIQKEGCQYFRYSPETDPFMPVEFAFAAFRMGHSMLTAEYEWNRVFQSAGPRRQPATLQDLFVFTERGGLKNQNCLLSSWIIDWTRFFDFSDFPIPSNEPPTHAGTIDALITSALTELHPIPNHGDETRSLAVRNLLRGLMVDLPAGQDVAKELGYPSLKPEDFADLPYYNTLRKFNFDEATPLWLYILQEASVQKHEGARLGPVGSRIVGETLVTLIQSSSISILPNGQNWQPSQQKFKMVDLLWFVNNTQNDFLNPLG